MSEHSSPTLDLMLAKSQLAAGLPQHQVGKWLGAKALEWPAGLGQDFDWQLGLAQHTGGSLNHAIDAWLAQQNHLELLERERQLALQGPKLTAKLIHFVPWLGLLAAQLFGLNPLGFLFGQSLGWLLLVFALVLSWAAAYWTRRIVEAFSNKTPEDPGKAYASLALMLRSGLGVGSGLRLLKRGRVGVPKGLDQILDSQTAFGGGLVEVLVTQANWERSRVRQSEREQLARLPIQLLYPVALLLLPQFMALTVLPVAASAFVAT